MNDRLRPWSISARDGAGWRNTAYTSAPESVADPGLAYRRCSGQRQHGRQYKNLACVAGRF